MPICPHMVVTAGIDATRDLDGEGANFPLPFRRSKSGGERLRNRDRTSCGQRAIIETRAGDDVVIRPALAVSRPPAASACPEIEQIPLADVGQDEILGMRDPNFTRC